MKNAKEIREITNEVLEEKNAKKVAKVKNYIEEIVVPQIYQSAYDGKEMLTLCVDIQQANIYEVMKILTNNGYEVKQGVKYPMIKIYW